MLSTHTASLHFAKTTQPSISLNFREDLLSMKQPRFEHRTVFLPDIDLDGYVFRAVIDWIAVRFHFLDKTQHQWIQDILVHRFGRKCWIDTIEPGWGNESDQFVIRFQEPVSAAQVHEISEVISRKFGELYAPVVAAIEVSVDAYPKVPSANARSLLLGVMQKTCFTKQNVFELGCDRPRYSIERGKAPVFLFPKPVGAKGFAGSHAWCWPQGDRTPPVDGTLSIGQKGGPVMMKLMDKVVDCQNVGAATHQELIEEAKRTRIEVTLNDSVLQDLGVRTIKDLRGFSFCKLQGNYFQFMLPTFRGPSTGEAKISTLANKEFEGRRKEKFLSTGMLGLLAFDHGWADVQKIHRKDLHRFLRERGQRVKPKRRGLGQARSYLAYAELSGRVATALRQLSGREKKAWDGWGRLRP